MRVDDDQATRVKKTILVLFIIKDILIVLISITEDNLIPEIV